MTTLSTKADDISLVIEEAIVSGELAPGTVLRQEQLSEQFDVSRTPIREALRKLAALGLVCSSRTAACACARSRARSCGRRSSSRGAREPATEAAAAKLTDEALEELDAAQQRFHRLTEEMRAREPGRDRRNLDGGVGPCEPRVPRRDLRGRGPAAGRAAREERAAHVLRPRGVGSRRRADRRALRQERPAAPRDPAGARRASAEGARALAREHVLSSFHMLEEILEQVGAKPWQP